MKYVFGTQTVINNLMRQKDKRLDRIAVAVEKTCVDVANHAKAGHAGNQAHMSNRYRNQTSTLTRSIMPELESVSYNAVVGIVYSNVEYAAMVELGTAKHKPYPYLYPAIVASKDTFTRRIKEAMAS